MFDITRRLAAWREFDARRPGLPGEHWGAFGAGLAALASARHRRSPGARGLLVLLGSLLVLRALAGRDGPIAQVRHARRPDGTSGAR